MKSQQKRLQQLNITLSEEDVKNINLLRENYAINISACFKIFLKKYLEKLKLIKTP